VHAAGSAIRESPQREPRTAILFCLRASAVHHSGQDLLSASGWFGTEFLCAALKHSKKVRFFVKKMSIIRFEKKNSAVQ
ncbi:MAG: hypothetical protein PVI92_15835, partial [Chromatiales bacterium]